MTSINFVPGMLYFSLYALKYIATPVLITTLQSQLECSKGE
jgi:hypothetical protein